MQKTIDETKYRREKQMNYNKANNNGSESLEQKFRQRLGR